MKPSSLVPILLAAAVPAFPQADPVVASGDKVRFIVAGSNFRHLGATVMEVQPDALVVRTSAGEQPRRIALSGVSRLEVARGRRSNFGKGFLIGFIPGAAFGAVAGAGLSCGDGATNCASAGGALVGAAVVGATTGLLGGLIGHAVRTDRWVPVPTQPRGRARLGGAVIPARGGVGARLSVTF
jgi:hypothetical protein